MRDEALRLATYIRTEAIALAPENAREMIQGFVDAWPQTISEILAKLDPNGEGEGEVTFDLSDFPDRGLFGAIAVLAGSVAISAANLETWVNVGVDDPDLIRAVADLSEGFGALKALAVPPQELVTHIARYVPKATGRSGGRSRNKRYLSKHDQVRLLFEQWKAGGKIDFKKEQPRPRLLGDFDNCVAEDQKITARTVRKYRSKKIDPPAGN